jgi:hypothetical protein
MPRRPSPPPIDADTDSETEATSWLIPGSAWHPLSGVPAPDYVPAQWDGPHVGRRLIEAFRTLSLMPVSTRPRSFRSSWPDCAQEATDYFAAAIDQTLGAELEEGRNRVRLTPTGVEIQRMEQAIGWPAHYLASRAMLAVVVQEVASQRARSSTASLERIARRLRRSPTYLRRCNRAGLDLIAAELRRDSVPVF